MLKVLQCDWSEEMSEEDHQDSDNRREVIAGDGASCSKGGGLGNLRPIPSSSLLITLEN